jgi:tellurite resistance protein TerC
MDDLLFPLAGYWGFYAAFVGLILALLAIDLGIFNRRPHAVSFREALLSSLVWVALALAFCGALYLYTAREFSPAVARKIALEYLTGYIVEESLSIDNLFVFVLIFQFFAIPPRLQHRLLYFGILGAIVMRALFVAAGSLLLQYQWVAMVFGALLVVTGIRMMFGGEERIEPEKNPVLRLLRRFLPVTDRFRGHRFLVREGGKLMATPLLVTLVFLETTDLVFAIDSVPAIFGVTREPLVVFTSNIFAILGLRAMYFLLAGAVNRFYLLRYGLALVLLFVGVKMALLEDFPVALALAIILGIVGAATALSLLFPKREENGSKLHSGGDNEELETTLTGRADRSARGGHDASARRVGR